MKSPYTEEEVSAAAERARVFRGRSEKGLEAPAFHRKTNEPRSGRKDFHHRSGCDGFYAANKAQFNVAEPQYRIAQIVVTPRKEPQIRNRKNVMDATTDAVSAAQGEDAGGRG
jgi:hypothetical protein